jgi:peptide/nickel transport system substrate-binding protein
MTRQFEVDMPWRLGTARYQNSLAQPQVIGYKTHPVLLADWMYVDIEK